MVPTGIVALLFLNASPVQVYANPDSSFWKVVGVTFESSGQLFSQSHSTNHLLRIGELFAEFEKCNNQS